MFDEDVRGTVRAAPHTNTHTRSSPQHCVEASVKVDVRATFILVVELRTHWIGELKETAAKRKIPPVCPESIQVCLADLMF